MADRVWYASYGSNLLRERFLAYIRGGRAPGSNLEHLGCGDPTLPAQDHGIMILHSLLFAESVPQWEGGGVAFVNPRREEDAKTLGRMYLISREQFEDVVKQENGHRSLDIDMGIDVEETVRKGSSQLRFGLYGTLLHLGEEAGFPILTFTSSWNGKRPSLNPPGPRYLSVVVRGLKETFGLSEAGVLDYLRDVPGIRGLVPEDELARIVGEPPPPYSSSFT